MDRVANSIFWQYCPHDGESAGCSSAKSGDSHDDKRSLSRLSPLTKFFHRVDIITSFAGYLFHTFLCNLQTQVATQTEAARHPHSLKDKMLCIPRPSTYKVSNFMKFSENR